MLKIILFCKIGLDLKKFLWNYFLKKLEIDNELFLRNRKSLIKYSFLKIVKKVEILEMSLF